MPTHSSQPQFLTTAEAVDLTCKSYWVFRRYVRTGILPKPLPNSNPNSHIWQRDSLLAAWHDYQRQMAK